MMLDSYEFYRIIEDRVHGLYNDKEFMEKLNEHQIPNDIRLWLVAHVSDRR